MTEVDEAHVENESDDGFETIVDEIDEEQEERKVATSNATVAA